VGAAVGEVCFNTAMTGYEEVMTDPSYAGQIVTFTFPHIGNVGVNDEDLGPAELRAALEAWPGMEGRALAQEVCCREAYVFADPAVPTWRVAVLDGGAKANILHLLAATGAYVRVHPIDAPPSEFASGVDAVFVSNGPGDPAPLEATIRHLSQVVGKLPCLGICLGHQLLALALGASTYKLKFGHRGANQPVRDERTGRVEITSQNHGFAVNAESLAAVGGEVTHTHLNDQTISGFWHPGRRVFAVQYHPESNPGPHDSRHLFQQFRAFAMEGS